MDISYLHQTKCILNTHRHPLSVLSRLSISKHHHHNNININNNINARRSLRLGVRNMCMASSSDTLVSGKSSSPTVASKKDTDVDEHEDLKSWMHKNGLPPCKVVLKDRVAYDSRHPPIHYVAASEDLQMANTPLHVSAGHNSVEVVKFLLNLGPEKVELEAKNMYGETPLHLAAKNGCNEAVGLLLSHGAFVEATANIHQPSHTFLHQPSMEVNLQDPPLDMDPSFSSPPRGVILNNFAGDVTIAVPGFARGHPVYVERNPTSYDEVEVDNEDPTG